MDSADDLPEIQQTLKQIGGVSAEKVMLMPQAKRMDELIAKSPMVAQMCKETGFVFCQRLHILLYDGEKGKVRISDCRLRIADLKAVQPSAIENAD